MEEEKSVLRRIKKNEIDKVSRMMGECFVDYPLYDIFFNENKHRLECVYCFFKARTYSRMDYTYITEDGNIAVCVKRPGDSELPLWKTLLRHPLLFFRCMHIMPVPKMIGLISDLGKTTEPLQKQFYDPEKDMNIQVVCVSKEMRASGMFFKVLSELDDGTPAYMETHTKHNVELYEKMGAHLCGSVDWHGVTHYVLRREAVNKSAEKTEG